MGAYAEQRQPWVIRVAAAASPSASKGAEAGKLHRVTSITALVDTAARTLTIKSGTTTLHAIPLGIGFHSIPMGDMPALAQNNLLSAALDAGTAQSIVMHGYTTSEQIVTT